MSKQLSPERRAARAVAKQAAERRREASTRSWWFNPWVPGLLALVLVAASLVFALTRGGDDDPPQAGAAAAREWRDAALLDLRPLTGNVVQLGRTVTDWRAGRLSDQDAATILDSLVPSMSEARTTVAARAPLAGTPRARDDFALTASLYEQATRVARVATAVPAGPLRTQLQLQFFRLRDLADRYFDQADAELEPLLGRPRQVEGVEVRRTAEVPDWRSNGLAVGPPLDATSPRTALREYQDTRTQESFDAWKVHVQQAEIPSGTEEGAALQGGSAVTLRDLARRLVAASDGLHGSPDPEGERVVSTRVQLGLLVHAEAMRAAQAATLVPVAQRAALTKVAAALAFLGDSTWDPRLGARSTGRS